MGCIICQNIDPCAGSTCLCKTCIMFSSVIALVFFVQNMHLELPHPVTDNCLLSFKQNIREAVRDLERCFGIEYSTFSGTKSGVCGMSNDVQHHRTNGRSRPPRLRLLVSCAALLRRPRAIVLARRGGTPHGPRLKPNPQTIPFRT